METTGQINDVKDLYRVLEVHFGLCLAFYKLYIEKIIDGKQMIKEINAITKTTDYKSFAKKAIVTNETCSGSYYEGESHKFSINIV